MTKTNLVGALVVSTCMAKLNIFKKCTMKAETEITRYTSIHGVGYEYKSLLEKARM